LLYNNINQKSLGMNNKLVWVVGITIAIVVLYFIF
jgi:hypothetical protein